MNDIDTTVSALAGELSDRLRSIGVNMSKADLLAAPAALVAIARAVDTEAEMRRSAAAERERLELAERDKARAAWAPVSESFGRMSAEGRAELAATIVREMIAAALPHYVEDVEPALRDLAVLVTGAVDRLPVHRRDDFRAFVLARVLAPKERGR